MSSRYYNSQSKLESRKHRSRSKHESYDDMYQKDYVDNSRRHRSRSHSDSSKYHAIRSRSRSRRRYGRRSTTRSPFSTRKRHVGDRDNPEPSRVLGIFGLSLDTQERDLRDVFSKYGRISEMQIVHDRKTGRSRGFSFIYFENIEDAIAAKDALSGKEIDGHKIRIDFSITKRPHTPTPGIYLGKPTLSSYHRGGYYHDSYPSYGGYGDGGNSHGGNPYEDHRSSAYSRYRRSPSYNHYDNYSRSRSRSRSRSYYEEKRYHSHGGDRYDGYR
ncbi:hypothetical protein GJ496_009247 [Pomphorhynchus laevis]|nr:hypothetical protein GJ496_009247 [Pomphorhynchus laevis]